MIIFLTQPHSFSINLTISDKDLLFCFDFFITNLILIIFLVLAFSVSMVFFSRVFSANEYKSLLYSSTSKI